MADQAAKKAVLMNVSPTNKVDFTQALAHFKDSYDAIDQEFLEHINVQTGATYMRYFSDIGYNFSKKKKI